MAALEADGHSWSGGTWNGNSWSGSSWSGITVVRQQLVGRQVVAATLVRRPVVRQQLVGQLVVRQLLVRQQLERELLVGQQLVDRELGLAARRPDRPSTVDGRRSRVVALHSGHDARPSTGHARPLRIGITGPIGCGKSTVAGWLAERPGVVVIDADQVARDVARAGRAGPRRGRRTVRDGRAPGRWHPSTGRPLAASSSRIRPRSAISRRSSIRRSGRGSSPRSRAPRAAGRRGGRDRGDQAGRGRPRRVLRRGLARYLRRGGPASSGWSAGAKSTMPSNGSPRRPGSPNGSVRSRPASSTRPAIAGPRGHSSRRPWTRPSRNPWVRSGAADRAGSAPLVGSGQRRLRDDMVVHGRLCGGRSGRTGQPRRAIECVQREHVMMRPGRRTRPAIAPPAEPVHALGWCGRSA